MRLLRPPAFSVKGRCWIDIAQNFLHFGNWNYKDNVVFKSMLNGCFMLSTLDMRLNPSERRHNIPLAKVANSSHVICALQKTSFELSSLDDIGHFVDYADEYPVSSKDDTPKLIL